jgi:hypothetical protein
MVAADMSEPMVNLRGSGEFPVQVSDDQSYGANRLRRVRPNADLLPANGRRLERRGYVSACMHGRGEVTEHETIA